MKETRTKRGIKNALARIIGAFNERRTTVGVFTPLLVSTRHNFGEAYCDIADT